MAGADHPECVSRQVGWREDRRALRYAHPPMLRHLSTRVSWPRGLWGKGCETLPGEAELCFSCGSWHSRLIAQSWPLRAKRGPYVGAAQVR